MARKHVVKANAQNAFSLLELLTVMSILIILLGISGVALSPLIQSTKLTSAVNLVSAQLSLARQHAKTHNKRVEVRFYLMRQEPDNSETAKCSALRLYEISNIGTTVPLGKIRHFAFPIFIAQGAEISTALRNSPEFKGEEEIRNVGITSYYKLSFNPGGRTDLDPGKNWYLTFIGQEVSPTLDNLPSNFATLQIDSFSGQLKIYRP